MNPGDLVYHVNAPAENLRVKRIYDSVATVERIDEPKEWRTNYYTKESYKAHPVYVCTIENLKPKTNQLTLTL